VITRREGTHKADFFYVGERIKKSKIYLGPLASFSVGASGLGPTQAQGPTTLNVTRSSGFKQLF
jgi:hypothetical protein